MKVFSKLTLASVSVLALLTLAACGNSKNKTDSYSSTDSSASVKVNKDGSAELNSENGNSAKTNGSNGTVSVGN